MKILLISPYHGGSHEAWAKGYGRFSSHDVDLLTMPARFWKWRMHGAAATLARRFENSGGTADLLLATDMLDLTTFLALTRKHTYQTPAVLYMHENQLTYPLPSDKSTGPMRRQLGERDQHYAFINYASMLAADQVWFNSHYHLDAFFAALPNFLRHFPEYNELGTIGPLRRKSKVVPVGVDLQQLDNFRQKKSERLCGNHIPLVLWNQRWEYDKNPDDFFRALEILAARGVPFQVALCGQQFGRQPSAFVDWLARMDNRVLHAGYAAPQQYAQLLWQADITVSTTYHEFFGISVLEAIHAQTFPILPDRLSYPEIVPKQFHESCLYGDFASLVDRMGETLANIEDTRSKAALIAPAAARFGWQQLAPQYDARLAAIVGLTV